MGTIKVDSQELIAVFGVLVAALVAVVYMVNRRRGRRQLNQLLWGAVGVYAVVHIVYWVYIWVNHISFPLTLEAMELVKLTHVRRIAEGLPLYVDATPDFVPLVYNPLYYYLVVPFTWLTGLNLFTMRLVAILAIIGSEIIIFLAVRKYTRSNYWAILAVGLFAASYSVMDTYLDNANADSWLLFSVLAGCYLIDLNHSRKVNLLGVLFLILGFWFKQFGAIFVAGALLFLTVREGVWRSWPYWLVAILFGPVAYFAAPASLFGPRFLYYTWELPGSLEKHWLTSIVRLGKYTAKYYAWLAPAAIIGVLLMLHISFKKITVWHALLPIAIFSGISGASHLANNNNVYIPMGVWFIVVGMISLKYVFDRYRFIDRYGIHLFVLIASFGALYYDPFSVIVPPRADTAYADLVNELQALNGPVYAPWLGEMQGDYDLYPDVHFVPMVELVRTNGGPMDNNPVTRELLAPVIHPRTDEAYILLNWPLEQDGVLGFLADYYVLENDYENRYATLADQPKIINIAWPRYLYRYDPQQAAIHKQ